MSENYSGKRLGLPATGSNSMAPLWRRLLAIIIDWSLASFLSWAIFRYDNLATLVIFAITQWLFVATVGYSVGHRVLKLKVRQLNGSWVGFWRSLIRIGLILLVLPPTIWDSDGRGLHDKAAGTVLVRI
ncbi:MAG: RDD family protein [Actinomycetes bacterium]